MVETYTTQWFTVTGGDSTTHNPQSLVATAAPIVVLDAEIRWEGIESTEEVTETEYATSTNTTSATAVSFEDTEYNSAVGTEGTDGGSVTETIPSEPSGYDFEYIHISYSYSFDTPDVASGVEVDITYTDENGDSSTVRVSSDDADLAGTIGKWDNYSPGGSSYIGTDMTISFDVVSGDPAEFNQVKVSIQTYGTDQQTNSETSCTSYPSVPSGYTFDRHYYREEKNGSTVSSDYSYTNSVGDERCVTSDDPSTTWELLMRTRGSDGTTTTQTLNTVDPSVSGDVSGAYSGTLTDGEQSPWQSLSGLTADSETFTHQIGESGTAKFQFRFDWAYDAATPTHGTVGFLDAAAGVWRECAVAAPDDPALQYDHVGVYNDATSAWGVLDLVDASADGAISGYEVYDPDVGWLAPRQYSTTAI